MRAPGNTLPTQAREVLQVLVLWLHTARNHVRNILTKLGARSTLHPVAFAIRHEIAYLDDEPSVG